MPISCQFWEKKKPITKSITYRINALHASVELTMNRVPWFTNEVKVPTPPLPYHLKTIRFMHL